MLRALGPLRCRFGRQLGTFAADWPSSSSRSTSEGATMAAEAPVLAAPVPNGDAQVSISVKGAGRKEDFLKVYEALREELIDDELIAGQPEFAQSYLQQMLDFNVPGGKLNRGLAVADLLLILKGGQVTPEEVFRADALGWCIEWLQAFFLVADDIMDNSVTRRGQPCWFRMPKVGLLACNDYIILESCIYRILSRHFRDTPFYTRLLDLFHETTHQTAHGQMLDVTTTPIGTVDLTRYTLPTYMRIVTFKTAYYSFYLPVACGMLLGGVTDPQAFDVARDICVQMGQYFQIQDDYLDCYGDPSVIGKVGTDIQDNKCSWLVVQARDRVTPEQKAVLETNYGKDDEAAVEAVKKLYRDLELEAVFQVYEQESYEKLQAVISSQSLLPPAVFNSLLAKIYKRSK